MRRLHRYVLLFLVITLFPQQILPQTRTPSSPNTTTSRENAKPKPQQPICSNNGTYVNSKGETVPRPEDCSAPPKQATAQCRDGTYSFSRSRRGTCSHHGGVAKWL